MTLDEARALLDGPLWPMVRDRFLETGVLAVYPRGDRRRLEWLSDGERTEIETWLTAVARVAEWRKVVEGVKVRELRSAFGTAYPEVFRYESYFAACRNDPDAVFRKLLKVRFPKAYQLCFEL